MVNLRSAILSKLFYSQKKFPLEKVLIQTLLIFTSYPFVLYQKLNEINPQSFLELRENLGFSKKRIICQAMLIACCIESFGLSLSTNICKHQISRKLFHNLGMLASSEIFNHAFQRFPNHGFLWASPEHLFATVSLAPFADLTSSVTATNLVALSKNGPQLTWNGFGISRETG